LKRSLLNSLSALFSDIDEENNGSLVDGKCEKEVLGYPCQIPTTKDNLANRLQQTEEES
jgi:hypothetical protein